MSLLKVTLVPASVLMVRRCRRPSVYSAPGIVCRRIRSRPFALSMRSRGHV